MTDEIEINESKFPYIIREADQPVRSLITIANLGFGGGILKDYFHIINGDIRASEHNRGLRSWGVSLAHSFARDGDGSRAYLADFALRGLELKFAGASQLQWAGLLTAINFYPAGEVEDPFKDIQEHWEFSENCGYPYLPPRVHKLLRLPLEVEVNLYYNVEDGEEWLQQILEQVETVATDS